MVIVLITAAQNDAVKKLSKNATAIESELLEMKSLRGSPAPLNPGLQPLVNVPWKKKVWKKIKNIGVFSRPLELTRKLIRMLVMQTLADLGFLVLFMILIVTVVRLLPLLLDLRKHKTLSPTRFTTRVILVSIL